MFKRKWGTVVMLYCNERKPVVAAPAPPGVSAQINLYEPVTRELLVKDKQTEGGELREQQFILRVDIKV